MLLLFALLVVGPTQAQTPATPDVPEADMADVESVDAIMAAVYDVISGPIGEKRDWDRFRSLFHPEAKLIQTGRNPNTGQGGIGYMSLDDYIRLAGPQLEGSGFFENELHRVTERFGDVVHIFSTYDSRRKADDPEPFSRGINSFQLRYDGTRYWVINIFWQSENQFFPIPEKYLPTHNH